MNCANSFGDLDDFRANFNARRIASKAIDNFPKQSGFRAAWRGDHERNGRGRICHPANAAAAEPRHSAEPPDQHAGDKQF